MGYLLPAKVNKGFRIYVVPINFPSGASVGLLCAFFDDEEEPLTIWRPLDNTGQSADLIHAILRPDVLVHLFDDHNRERLGYRAEIIVPLLAKVQLEHIKYGPQTHETEHLSHQHSKIWFGLRNSENDANSIRVEFKESLVPEDIVTIDFREEVNNFNNGQGFIFSTLERPEPGSYQESDIIGQLRRIFPPEQIYHAPKRHYDLEEIADIVVITDLTCLIVQAKDSPNTKATLDRTISRKKRVSINMVKEATKQASGAINYLRRTRPLRMILNDREVTIDLGNRSVLSLVVVRELFLDTYGEYSKELFAFLDKEDLPCIALDYEELHQYTTFCGDEHGFLHAYFQLFNNARNLGEFPRLRFGLDDAKRLLGDTN
ncbi:hypothetical protein [Acidovorax sp. Root219]|uniref:hypothetical protein n=1 Tax=Acidovorax sp. Root219 TaxID=1736493 RepID=UPI0012F7B357|nr:hypothetical protein [Acidovorax sp. Root219]